MNLRVLVQSLRMLTTVNPAFGGSKKGVGVECYSLAA